MIDEPHQDLDPLGDLVRAGLEIERSHLAAIERLSAEIIRLTRALGPDEEISRSVRSHMRVPAVVDCFCCKECAEVPCFESIVGEACVDQCVCVAPVR